MPDVGGIAGAQLKSFIERIERLEDEKRALGEDIKEVYAEAKGSGFEPKIMRQIIKIRRMDKEERAGCGLSRPAAGDALDAAPPCRRVPHRQELAPAG